MKSLLIKPAFGLKGEIALSGDKSIAHRSIILGSLAPGKTTIENFPSNKDCQKTISIFKKLGIKIRQKSTRKGEQVITVFGKGLEGLKKPKTAIFVGDSGTTLRLLLGILAGQNFETKLIAGKSLSQRPMLRVTEPLRMMGAKIYGQTDERAYGQREEYPPIIINGGNLKAITYRMSVASAQVKSAILLAGLYARGKTRLIEPIKTRDHTERMLKLFKARIKVQQNSIIIKGGQELVSPRKIIIPGDISSASFFIALASLLPNAKLRIRKVSLNPSRYGIIRVLKRMGADIWVTGYALPAGRQGLRVTNYEPMGDIIVKSSVLKGTVVKKEEIPSLIDELPILMVAASFAKGRTVFEGVGELRVKETDRIRSMSENLKKMGAIIQVNRTAKTENIIIKGVKILKGTRVKSFGDHRTAMSMVVAGLKAQGNTLIDDISCINKSFPDFLALLKPLIKYKLC
jgi:3-phosphoshikimate 1-carboxyvinyltransferase